MTPTSQSGDKAFVTILPARIQSERLIIKHWGDDDAEALSQAVVESYEHLRPWMGWVDLDSAQDLDETRARFQRWYTEWEGGGDSFFGIFKDDVLVGSCGLHRRGSPDSLEIGYWIDVRHTRLGYAKEAAAALTEAALNVPDVERVEIHHDKANVASGRIPARLGYELTGEWPQERVAPAEVGIECRWVLTRSEHAKRQPSS